MLANKILDDTRYGWGNITMKILSLIVPVCLMVLCVGCDEVVELSPTGVAYRVGEEVTVGRLGIRVDAIKNRPEVGGDFFGSKAPEGGVYVVVDWSYENVSKEPISGGIFATPDCYLVSPEGTRYNQDLGASMGLGEEKDIDEKLISDLNPGIRVKSACVFEVSKELLDKKGWRIAIVTSDGQVWVKVPRNR